MVLFHNVGDTQMRKFEDKLFDFIAWTFGFTTAIIAVGFGAAVFGSLVQSAETTAEYWFYMGPFAIHCIMLVMVPVGGIAILFKED
jgi:hypothetical protein